MTQVESLSGVVVFVTVARARSFTLAAQRLGLTKSAVGKSVARLEERLGTRLFYRTTRKVTLTADGEAYLAACSGAIDEIARAESVLISTQAEASGRLRVDMPAAFGRRILLPLLVDIARAQPNLHLTMSFNDRVVDPTEDGFDLVVRFGPLGDLTGLVARKLTSQRLCICAAPTYLATRGEPLSLDELNSHDCIVNLRRDAPVSWQVLDYNGVPVRVTPPATYEAGDGDAILAMTVAGLGLSQMPSFMVSGHLAAGRLVPVFSTRSQVKVDVHALWPKSRHLLPRVRKVVDTLIHHASQGHLDEDPRQACRSTAGSSRPTPGLARSQNVRFGAPAQPAGTAT